jgi:hypothetical protein
MYANLGVNNSSEKLRTKQKTLRLSKNPRKNTATSGSAGNLKKYMFDAFMPVFGILTMKILYSVVSSVADEGV